MIGLDTNVLVRYLTQDDPGQAATATDAIEEAVEAGTPLFVSAVVLCEIVWVLERAYRLPRPEVTAALDALLRAAHLRFRDPALCRRALEAYRTGPGDFADHLLALDGMDAGCRTTLTFDRELEGSEGFRLLG